NNSVEPPSWSTPEAPTEVPAPTAAPESTPGSTPVVGDSATCPDMTDPESVILAMQAAGLPVGEYEVYTTETDPNGLMGRPLQYIAKATLHDTRLPSPIPSDFSYADGMSVEIFATPEDAQARYDY